MISYSPAIPTRIQAYAPRTHNARLAYVASYPPRQCGIATFTHDVMSAVERVSGEPALIVAMNDKPQAYSYPGRVALQIERNDLSSYVKAARELGRMQIDAISIQHEYGLFGGEWGEYLIEFCDLVRQPVVTTLHSVIPNPSPALRQVARALAERSQRLIVLANAATAILAKDYGIASGKVQMIPHGIPTVIRPEAGRREAKARFGYAGRTLLATFGLISPNKGIEVAINALTEVVRQQPDVLYLVIGQTHPGVLASEGEAYRTRLQTLVRDLGLEANVAFVNQYLTLPQLMAYLMACDLYVVPYLNPDQIVSGTLAYAMGSGRAVISTPFIHAREALANGNGVLVPFNDSKAMSDAMQRLLADPSARYEIERRAFASSRTWTWPAVAAQYHAAYQEVLQHAAPAFAL